MRLKFLPVNRAWAFLFGDTFVRLNDCPMFFHTRPDAISAARLHGLAVSTTGEVSVIEKEKFSF